MNTLTIVSNLVELLVAAGGCLVFYVSIHRLGGKWAKEIAAAAIAADRAKARASTYSTGTAEAPVMTLAPFDSQAPFSKDQFLLAVSIYAEAEARFNVLTRTNQVDLMAMNDEAASALVRNCSYAGNGGASLYGIHKIFLKYPDVSPAEFIEAYDRAYESSTKNTVTAIMAATTAAA